MLPSCTARDRIWNASDLDKWVRDQAAGQDFQRNSIQLEEWYRDEGNGCLIWHGKGLKDNRAPEAFAIRVDGVGTPSGG